MRSSDFQLFEPLFNSKENWGDLEKLNWFVPWMCFQIRKTMKNSLQDIPMAIHCAYEPVGHSENSYHYKGMAVDFHFNTFHIPFVSQYILLNSVLSDLKIDRFVGFGVYPHWQQKGFHLDFRGNSIRWIGLKDGYKYGDEKAIRDLLYKHG